MKHIKLTKPIIAGISIAVVLAIVGTVGALNGWFGGGGKIPEDTFTRGLVGYWSFDEGSGSMAYDASGNENHGELKPSATNRPQWTIGKVGGGLQFDGVDDYVVVADSPSLNISGNQITIMAWVRPTGFGADRIVVNKEDTYEIAISTNGVFRAAIETEAAGSWGWGGSKSVSLNQWSHIVFVYDGVNWNFYIQGTLVESIPPAGGQTGNILPSNNTLRIGNRELANYPFIGLIDDVRIYNYARSPEQILQDYNAGLGIYFK